MSIWTLVNYKGRLALSLPWETDGNQPREQRTLWVHPTEQWSPWYEGFTTVESTGNNQFICWLDTSRSWKSLSIAGWEQVFETRPVPMPGRGGKSWSWVWLNGRWRKEFK